MSKIFTSSLSSPLPSYLTSGASSRSHHALLTKLQIATKSEEDTILQEELLRCKSILENKASSAKAAETLIVVLHICMMVRSMKIELEWALIAALQLAESGKTVKERRIGSSS
jgi:AP-4 complex subunit epsilon-1